MHHVYTREALARAATHAGRRSGGRTKTRRKKKKKKGRFYSVPLRSQACHAMTAHVSLQLALCEMCERKKMLGESYLTRQVRCLSA